MDYFGREDLRELLERPEEPAVSIYLPTERTSAAAEADRLRFRAALDRADELLSSEYEEAGRALLDELRPLAEDEEFWRYQADGFVAFSSPSFQRMYRIPADVPELVVVAPTFHTRPLIEHLQTPDRYWVLGLSQKKVRLWEGSARGVTPIDLHGLPASLQEALGFEFERDAELVHRRRRGGLSRHLAGKGGRSPVFHGHGVGVDDEEPELRRFFKQVDRGLGELLGGEIGPVILGAVGEYHPIYRSVSGLENLAEEGIEASIAEWPDDRVHETAWLIAKREALEQVDRALELWESSYGRGKAELDLANLGRLAVAGRVRLLLTERDRRVWGTIDRETGRLEVLREGGDDPGQHAVELLDELAEMVLLKGGETLVLSEERMPTETGAAGVLR